MTSEPFTIRSATINDAQTIAIHRTGMFSGEGEMSPEAFELLRANRSLVFERFSPAANTSAGWRILRAIHK